MPRYRRCCRRVCMDNHDHSQLHSALPRLYARRSLSDGRFIFRLQSHFGGFLVSRFSGYLAGTRIFCHARILHSSGLRARFTHSLVQPDRRQRLSGLSRFKDFFYRHFRFYSQLSFVGIGGLLMVGLSGCVSIYPNAQQPVLIRPVTQPVLVPAHSPRLGRVFFMPQSQVTRISSGYVPAIVPGHAHPVPTLPVSAPLPSPKPTPFYPISHPAQAPLHTYNPWHCVSTKPPCTAASSPHRTWWRCVYRSHPSAPPALTAAKMTGISTAHFHLLHNSTKPLR